MIQFTKKRKIIGKRKRGRFFCVKVMGEGLCVKGEIAPIKDL